MATVTYHVGRFDFDRSVALVVAAVLALTVLGGVLLDNRSSFAADDVSPQTHYLEIETTREATPPGLSFNNAP